MALTKETDDPKAITLLKTGRDFESAKNYGAAAKCFRKALKLNITKKLTILLHDQITFCYKELGNYEKAEEYLAPLCEMKPTFQNIFDLMGIYNRLEDNEKKKKLSEKLKKLTAESDFQNRQILSMLISCKDFDEVIKRCREKIESEPENIEYGRKLFETYMAKEDFENAYEVVNQLIDNGFEDEMLYELYGLYNRLLDLETSFSYMRRYIKRQKERNNMIGYIAGLAGAIVSHVYDDVFPEEEYLEYIREYHRLKTPTYTPSFNINTDYFRKIRVGFISYDFKRHSVGSFAMSLFDVRPNNSGIEVYCYYTCPNISDSVTEAIEYAADVFQRVGKLPDAQLKEVIRKDDLDILIDLSGQTLGNRLEVVRERLAPIQMTWMGYPNSTFMPNIDYLIGDPYTDPEDGRTEKWLTEKPVRMKSCYMCFALGVSAPIWGLPYKRNGYITFGCFNNPIKFSNKTLRMWARILEKMPTSKLLIRYAKAYGDFVLTKFKERFKTCGVDMERVSFEKTTGILQYFNSYNDVDIILDTYPFGGITTACETFSMGVPIIALKGDRRESRCGYSLLENVGLGDLAADTDEEYVEKACELANDIERLLHIRGTLRETLSNSPLYDTKNFRAEFERLIRDVYIYYCTEHKKDFEPEYKDMDQLIRSCLLAIEYLKGLIKDKKPMDSLRPLVAEFLEMLKIFSDALIDIYSQDKAALMVVQNFINTITLLSVADEPEVMGIALESILKYVIQLM